MYIDDLSRVLERIDNDPVKLNGTPISCLMYADDMILLSSSSCGLQKSLNTLGMYCKKWQLIVNTQKTKVMIFNKNTTKEVFKYLGNILEITKEYTYLELSFSKSGSFTNSIKLLNLKAQRAYFALKNMLRDTKISPKLFTRLFDSLIRPILLYASEIWGGFGIKKGNKHNYVYEQIMFNDKTPYEKVNIMLSKQCLQLPRRASNMASMAELGRLPLRHHIIVAMLKYQFRYLIMNDNELVSQAFLSQAKLTRNSSNTMTYTQVCQSLKTSLGVNESSSDINNTVLVHNIKTYGDQIKMKSLNKFKCLFENHVRSLGETDSKLMLYGKVKRQYSYETYFDSDSPLLGLAKSRSS